MDYGTKAVRRKEIRKYAQIFRNLFGLNQFDPIDPVRLLDCLGDEPFFAGVVYEIVEDDVLPESVPAQCTKTEEGYLIEIKESVYIGACEKRIGGYRMHIMHEIIHVFADLMGFKPMCVREETDDFPRNTSLEWIVKAMAGEVMIPYEASRGMAAKEIMQKFGVSLEAAEYRLKI